MSNPSKKIKYAYQNWFLSLNHTKSIIKHEILAWKRAMRNTGAMFHPTLRDQATLQREVKTSFFPTCNFIQHNYQKLQKTWTEGQTNKPETVGPKDYLNHDVSHVSP